MFNWSDNITVPKITDLFNETSDVPFNLLHMFTYVWIWFLGGWFIAGVIGVLGGALYIKYDNAMVPIAFFIVMMSVFGGVLSATPLMSGLPSAEPFKFLLGLIVAFGIGISLYLFYVNSKE